ncbi:hypothetical protein BCR35DRAFT_353144 [Leucosporidium creatinivorum]|uniref:Uncharacterized protein n=1 Tax=Leucosporidium creatinivorum TaxID=106004 RepID=A0A1Y2F1Q1_9BASI|nr:hypothetical protein BCR35DRAFT_353144 [Leucosporidium creatinivorum]
MNSIVNSWRNYWYKEPPPPPPPPSILTFPPLPPELILYILTLSLPHPTYSSLSTSPSPGSLTTRLHQLASLHPSFSSHFTRLSHAHIRLPTLDSAARFLRRCQREGWAERVRTLRIGPEEGEGRQWMGDGAVVGELLRVCKGVKELWVVGLAGLELEYLGEGKNLQTLYLTETRLTLTHHPSSPPSLLLPSLTHLHLRSTIFSGASLPLLLSPSTLPNLRTLDYLSVHQSLVGRDPAPPLLPGGVGGGGAAGGNPPPPPTPSPRPRPSRYQDAIAL